MMTQGQEKRYVTPAEAADLLRDEMIENGWRGGANTIESWIIRGAITKYWRGRRRVIDLDELRAYIKTFGLRSEIVRKDDDPA